MMAEKINLVLVKRGMKKQEFAEKFGCSRPNMYKRLKNDNFTEQEMQKIAEILNCTCEINLIMNDTKDKF